MPAQWKQKTAPEFHFKCGLMLSNLTFLDHIDSLNQLLFIGSRNGNVA